MTNSTKIVLKERNERGAWAENVACNVDKGMRNDKELLVGNPDEKELLRRPKCR
jgi:hypothetical protein